ncbi:MULTISPECIES: hypothetical protein [Ferroplasma]|uniref:hypothetical protein n=1 Tax=Ferroplasma TaxID=74968 RepID=UPI0023F03F55|nr:MULTISPECIES: hypothetical protein [Ferroplasma]
MGLEMKFNWNEIVRKYETSSNLKPDEVILLLLKFGKISGRTMLQKQVFIAYKEILKDSVSDLLFHPDQYGPYSRLIADAVAKLKIEGDIKIMSKGESHSTYYLTKSGEDHINDIIKNKKINGVILKKLEEQKRDWDEWATDGIIQYVYRNYPEYATKTKVPRLKWE